MAESNVSQGDVVSSDTLQPGQGIHENEDPTTSYGTTLSGSEPTYEYLVTGDARRTHVRGTIGARFRYRSPHLLVVRIQM